MFRGVSSCLTKSLLVVLCSLTCMQCKPVSPAAAPSNPPALGGLTALEPLSASRSPAAPASDPDSASPAHRHLVLAESDPLALLEEALARWAAVESYRLRFTTQERLGGVLGGPSIIEAAVLREPQAVSFRWLDNPGRVDGLVWMPSAYQNKLVVHPTGVLGRLVGTVRLDPDSETVRANSRRSVTQFGLAGTLESVAADFRRQQQAGGLKCQCLGVVECGHPGTRAILLKRIATDPASESRTLLLWLAPEDLRPMKLQQYGWSDELLASYTFEDYRPERLSRDDFTLAALGLQ